MFFFFFLTAANSVAMATTWRGHPVSFVIYMYVAGAKLEEQRFNISRQSYSRLSVVLF